MAMIQDDHRIKMIYDIFIKCNSLKHNIPVAKILNDVKIYNQSRNYFLPEYCINDFEEGDIVQGRDFCMYIIKTNGNNIKYWKKLKD